MPRPFPFWWEKEIYIYIYVCMYICKWTKLRVTENWCVLFNSLTYIYIYIAKWPSVLPINKSIKQVTWATEPLTLKQNTDQKGEQRTAKQPRPQTNHQTNLSWKAEKCCKYIPLQSYLKEPSWEFGFNHVRSSFRVIRIIKSMIFQHLDSLNDRDRKVSKPWVNFSP